MAEKQKKDSYNYNLNDLKVPMKTVDIVSENEKSLDTNYDSTEFVRIGNSFVEVPKRTSRI